MQITSRNTKCRNRADEHQRIIRHQEHPVVVSRGQPGGCPRGRASSQGRRTQPGRPATGCRPRPTLPNGCRKSSTTWCCSISVFPTRTGLQALRALRAVADLTPIIVLTGSDDYKQGLVRRARRRAGLSREAPRQRRHALAHRFVFGGAQQFPSRPGARHAPLPGSVQQRAGGAVHRQPRRRAQDRERRLREAARPARAFPSTR